MLTVDQILERTQWDFFWIPEDATVVDRPEILYVHCPRDVSHLNAVTRLRATPGALPALLEEVRAAHREVESRVMVVPHVDSPALREALLEQGYGPEHAHDAMAVEVDAFAPRPHPGVIAGPVTDRAGLEDALAVTSAAFGRPLAVPPDQLDEALADCTRPGSRVARFLARDEASGAPLCAGGLTAFPELSFGLLWGGGTVPDARGRGAYSAVVAARVAEARLRGLARVGLYARLETSAPICERQGFERHGRMVFWQRKP